MWPIVLLALSLVSTLFWYKTRSHNKYRLDILALISGSTAVMFLVDSLYGYLEEGEFLETSLNAITLSVVLVALTVVMWIIVLVLRKTKIS